MASARTLLLAAACGAALAAPAGAQAQASKPVNVQLLALNDFHGNLEAPTGSGGRIGTTDAGGAASLASHVKFYESRRKHTTFVSAGDLIGASPLLSALFHDEPTIESMNAMGLDLNAVGNHEFDEGAKELRRMQRGGCHPKDGCQDGDGFAGAKFRFLAANVVDRDGDPIFRPYVIKRYGKVRVGYIGMTLEGTPNIVSQAGIQGLRFLDEARTANRYARILRKRHGVRSVVVLLHEGGIPAAGTGYDDCAAGISGPIVDIVNRTTDAVDAFFTGHTHNAYNCVVDGRPVTSAASNGRLLTRMDMRISPRTGDVTGFRVNNKVVTRNVFQDPLQTKLIGGYREVARPLANRQIGRITQDITRAPDAEGENALGNLIADAQWKASEPANRGGAVAAFMNPGGVRADLLFRSSSEGEGDGVVTYGESFSVQPFGNNLVTLTYTGAQVKTMLEQQFCGNSNNRVLLPSASVSYVIDRSQAAANRGKPCSGQPPVVSNVTIGGQALDPARDYRITVNSFLAGGGDSFPVLTEGRDPYGGVVDTDALEAYFRSAGGPIASPGTGRITSVE